MSNSVATYNPILYANMALRTLWNRMGMARTVSRGFDPMPGQKGDPISIRRPSVFVAQDAPSTTQDITAEYVNLNLSKWKESKFALTDKEVSQYSDGIIDDHMDNCARSIAQVIDSDLSDLYKFVGNYTGTAGTPVSAVSDIIAARTKLNTLKAPTDDLANMHLMIDPTTEGVFLGLTAFSNWQGSAQPGVDTQLTGNLNNRYGFNIFMNQNVKTHTKGTASTGTLAINSSTAAIGDTSVAMDAGSVTGTLVAGDSFTVAGDTQRYCVTATANSSGNAFSSVSFAPGFKVAPANDAVVTVQLHNGVRNLAYHRDAFALGMRALTQMPGELGAKCAVVSDPVTNLSVRATIWYDGNNRKVMCAIDALYGVVCLDTNMATAMLA